MWSGLSYTTRLTVAFAAIAAMTALVSLGVLSFVWEQHFQDYTEANLKSTANNIANGIAKQYVEQGSFYNEDGTVNESVVQSAQYVYDNSTGVGIIVYDSKNKQSVWNSTLTAAASEKEEETGDQAQVPTDAQPDEEEEAEASSGTSSAADDADAASAATKTTASTTSIVSDEGQAVAVIDSGEADAAAEAEAATSADATESAAEAESAEAAGTNTASTNAASASSASSEQGDDSSSEAASSASTTTTATTTTTTQSQQPTDNYVEVPITVDHEEVGTVLVWVYGSNTLLFPQDVEFREKSYQAMVLAAAIAVVLALCIGFLFARNLVRPINRMTLTAKAIKEGDLSARTDLHGDDEISRLGETFDAMAESVEKDRQLERRLTTDVAHELRTPLMAIQSTVEAMVDGVFEFAAERLSPVNSEVQRLSRLVGALLKLSRLENRSMPMKEEVVDVGQLVAGIISTHDAFVRDSGLSITFAADKDVCVNGDADMIRQATANLISNAVRYTPEGGTISVSVRRGDIMAAITVQDTGIGLTPEEARMVFSRFWRADAGRNRESGGLGIGLSVVKEIVDRHGGWVHVEGRPNEGATFTIYIPLYDEPRDKGRQKKDKEKEKDKDKD